MGGPNESLSGYLSPFITSLTVERLQATKQTLKSLGIKTLYVMLRNDSMNWSIDPNATDLTNPINTVGPIQPCGLYNTVQIYFQQASYKLT